MPQQVQNIRPDKPIVAIHPEKCLMTQKGIFLPYICATLTDHDVCILNLYSKDKLASVCQLFGVVVSSPDYDAGASRE